MKEKLLLAIIVFYLLGTVSGFAAHVSLHESFGHPTESSENEG